MNINGVEIAPGEEKVVDVNIARLPSHTPIDVSITIARSSEPGPTLLLMGGLHGDEINGSEIVRRIIEKNEHIPKIGSVICIPIINVYGFIYFSRYVPDGKDVNRSFPGNKNGSLAARMAYFLTKEILPVIDYGIDFHTGGADRTNYPQIRCMMKDDVNVELAKAFHAPFTLDSKFRPKSLRQTANKFGKNILVYEGGESSRFDEYAIKEGINGAKRMMKHLGMRDEAENAPYQNLIIKNSSWVRAKKSGVFLSAVKSGDAIKKNQLLGHIHDPFGGFKSKIKSVVNGYVIGLNHNPIVHEGDAIMHLGVIK
ncbi:succinylglutamate desuccinylase/aspartoacylase family protein [Marivirga arenosa]|uniref:Succinylglutamate desuccinylase/aspartoacylase family protein n=1 Tax=Marivirga arenosa TaxID=3059076 RepID=A0AA51RD86_9BACT|nr:MULTISPECIES: succinylglutamate desuccinylase/aspartoacylase family protein [unclassified Marivirga]WMN06785.1 succinylglutamate desuccinylase/aspartoacylase family protein [Marivirga sp. ABR2-2]WNB16887.1 succinylglutamate desuccinylase/aspartoacylase family protein [Marivirga sp. BKB1-2]